MRSTTCRASGLLLLGVLLGAVPAVPTWAATLSLDFNAGVDDTGKSAGDLVFFGPGGFSVTITDDESSGTYGGNAEGVHITNQNYGNIKVGSSTDFVVGAFNSSPGPGLNYHSSGIVAYFSQGVTSFSLFDTDDDLTTKTLFAFDEFGNVIATDGPDLRRTFTVDTTMTGGVLIYGVEFDTQPGPAGGSFDRTVFTVDDFQIVYDIAVPEPALGRLAALASLAIVAFGRRLGR